MDEVTNRLEYLFLKIIIAGLKDESISTDSVKDLAGIFLGLEPFVSFEDTEKKIGQFVSKYPYFNSLEEYLKAYEHEKATDSKIEKMREHMKNNNIEAAIQVAKT